MDEPTPPPVTNEEPAPLSPSLREHREEFDPRPAEWTVSFLTVNLFLLVIFLIFTFFYWGTKSVPFKVAERIARYGPLLMDANLVLYVGLMILCARGWWELLRSISRKTWICVGIIAVVGFLTVYFVAPRTHRIYYDEDIYGDIALCISHTGAARMSNVGLWQDGTFFLEASEYNKQPNAFPYFLSLIYRVVGPSEALSHLANNLTLVASIIVVFLIARILFEKENLALYAALIYTAIPNNHRWGNTMAAEPMTALFLGLTVLCALFFCLRPGAARLALLASISAFAVQFRIEGIMIGLVVLLTIAMWRPREFGGNRLYLAGVLFMALVPHHLAHVNHVKHQNWGSQTAKFASHYLWTDGQNTRPETQRLEAPMGLVDALKTKEYRDGNLYNNIRFFFSDPQFRFPVPFAWLFLLGLLASGRILVYPNWTGARAWRFVQGIVLEARWDAKAVVLLWFAQFWGIFLVFYAGSYYYGADDRFTLLSFIPVSLLAAVGVEMIERFLALMVRPSAARGAIAAALLMIAGRYYPTTSVVTHEAWLARADHAYALEMIEKLPKDCIVVSHDPSIFTLHGVSSVLIAIAADNPQRIEYFLERARGGVYLHWGFWAVIADEAQQQYASRARENFDCIQVAEKTVGHFSADWEYTFRFYRMEKKEPVPIGEALRGSGSRTGTDLGLPAGADLSPEPSEDEEGGGDAADPDVPPAEDGFDGSRSEEPAAPSPKPEPPPRPSTRAPTQKYIGPPL